MATTRTVDSTIRVAFSLVHGLLLAMMYPLMFIIMPNFVKPYPLLSLLLVIPAVSFISGFGLSAFSQYLYCGSINPAQISLVSTFAPLFVIGFGVLAYFLPFLRGPVQDIMPVSADADMKYALGFSFYLLWAGIYGQNLASSMVQSCPGAAGPK
jgi:hypothetical protein